MVVANIERFFKTLLRKAGTIGIWIVVKKSYVYPILAYNKR